MTTQEKNAQRIVGILEKAGYTALFAGGYVRDKIMKRKASDIDIATSAKPEEIKKVLEKTNIRYIEIGEQFGVIAAVIPKDSTQEHGANYIFEIATFREDHGVGDSRHPESVRLGVTPEEDAKRRDFTINGLFANFTKRKLHKTQTNSKAQNLRINTKRYTPNALDIIDFVDGLTDIKAKTIRFIGNPEERIREDALRILRAIRFSVQLGFTIEEQTLTAIKKHTPSIQKVSGERIRDELNKILISGNPRRGFELLDETGLLHEIMPEFDIARDTPQPINMHLEGNVWNHTLLALEKAPRNPCMPAKGKDPLYFWSVLLHDVAKPHTIMMPEEGSGDRIRFNGHDSIGAQMAITIMRRLRFSNDEIDKVSWLVKYHLLFGNLQRMREARRIRYLKHPYFEYLLELFWVDANSSVRSNKYGKPLQPNLNAYQWARRKFEAESNKKPLPKPIIRGGDVMRLMGITDGNRYVGEILDKLYDAQLEKKFTTKKEGLTLAKKLLKKNT